MKKAVMAIVTAVIVCTAAAGVYIIASGTGSGGETDGTISIVDGSGATITLSEPLTGVVTANTNIPKAMKILGLTDELKGLSFYTASTNQSNWDLYSPLFNKDVVHMPLIQSMTAESIVAMTGCKYIICPVTSMTITASQETSFKEFGITIIRLDCNGDSALDDLEKLTVLFGKTDKVVDAYDSYCRMYDGVVSTVTAAVAASPSTQDRTFLSYMSSLHAFYNETSAISVMTESIYGKNALRGTGLPLIGPTNPAGEMGTREVIKTKDSNRPIDKIFVRGTATTNTPSAALAVWQNVASVLPITGYDLSPAKTDEVYVFHTNIMSGMLSFIGYVAIAEVCGIDTGLSISDLIAAFNTAYGFTEATSGYVFKMTGGGTGFAKIA